ncbi:MAG: serine/threonine dehydratase [Alphaproteobacteria bacterium]|nr:serine/threonine dehydratase [Alphaproteobacteria bacterium]
MTFTPIHPSEIENAHKRISPYLIRTPLMESQRLNNWLGHRLLFKMESFQRIGAFKARGALNTLLTLKEQGHLPKHVVAFSSGNHGQAVAWAGSMLDIKTTVILPEFTSKIKQQATRGYGADVILTKTRKEAEALCAEFAKQGAYFIHPFDNDNVIAGQGTACYEALLDGPKPDAIFVTCSGGGWVSGTLLASQLLCPDVPLYAGEPLQANDASRSYQSGEIFRFHDSPPTIADGARTLSITDRTFFYLKQLAGFFDIPEQDIIYWTQWLYQLLKVSVEPTSAVAMAAASQWLKTQTTPKTLLVMISGGNIAPETHRIIWEKSYLENTPGA